MADDAPLTLYAEPTWVSPYVFSCFVALREKRLPFDVVEIPLHEGAHTRAPFRDRSITAKVPALTHGGFWLAESSAIIEYLEEVFPPPAYPRLLPGEVHHRARARQVMAWIRSDLLPLREERPTTTLFYHPSTTALSAAGHEAAKKLVRVAERLLFENVSSLFGAWSIADAELALMLHRLISNGHPVPAKVRAFAESAWQRPSVQEFVRHARPSSLPG